VAEIWQNSGLKWSLFVPSTEVQTFLRESKLDWLEKVILCKVYVTNTSSNASRSHNKK